MRTALCAVLLAFLSALSTVAFADEAKVVWVDPSCNYLIAQVGDEFGIFEWRAGSEPAEGDVLDGPFRTEGIVTVTNATKGGSNSVILVALSPRLKSLINSSPVNCKKRYRSS
jgi:hypothetical protein